MTARDAAEYNEASYEFDFAAHCDRCEREAQIRDCSDYREACESFLRTLNDSLSFIADHGYHKSTTLWGIAYALGHPMIAGKSMLETARDCGCTKAAISKISCDYLRQMKLPPSPALKSEAAKEKYKQTNGHRKSKPITNN